MFLHLDKSRRKSYKKEREKHKNEPLNFLAFNLKNDLELEKEQKDLLFSNYPDMLFLYVSTS